LLSIKDSNKKNTDEQDNSYLKKLSCLALVSYSGTNEKDKNNMFVF